MIAKGLTFYIQKETKKSVKNEIEGAFQPPTAGL